MKGAKNNVRWIAIQDIAYLKVHRPIRTDQHIARSVLYQRIHHRSSLLSTHQLQIPRQLQINRRTRWVSEETQLEFLSTFDDRRS